MFMIGYFLIRSIQFVLSPMKSCLPIEEEVRAKADFRLIGLTSRVGASNFILSSNSVRPKSVLLRSLISSFRAKKEKLKSS